MKLNIALSQIRNLLKNVKLTQEALTDGSLIQYDGEEGIQNGQPVYLADGAQDWSLLPDGSYLTKDQVKFTIEAGVVSSVNENAQIKSDATNAPIKQAQSAIKPEVVLLSGSGGTEAHDINLPAAGAPDSLINPDLISADDSYSTCMSALNELSTKHGVLQNTHNQLRMEHDDINKKHNALVGRFDEMDKKITKMASDLKKANDDKELMSKQIKILSRAEAGTQIEEVKLTSNSSAPDMKENRAYQIMHS